MSLKLLVEQLAANELETQDFLSPRQNKFRVTLQAPHAAIDECIENYYCSQEYVRRPTHFPDCPGGGFYTRKSEVLALTTTLIDNHILYVTLEQFEP